MGRRRRDLVIVGSLAETLLTENRGQGTRLIRNDVVASIECMMKRCAEVNSLTLGVKALQENLWPSLEGEKEATRGGFSIAHTFW